MPIRNALIIAAALLSSLAPPAAAQTYFQSPFDQSIRIPSDFDATMGVSSPFGQRIYVFGMKRPILRVGVILDSISHTSPDDLLIVLQSPAGTTCVLSSRCWGDDNAGGNPITFDDAAPEALPVPGRVSYGSYRPTDCDPAASLTAPGPARPYGTSLSVFDGEDANGEWRLWIEDLQEPDRGGLSSWTLIIQEDSPGGAVTYVQTLSTEIPDDRIAGIGPAEEFPFVWNVFGLDGVLSSVAVRLYDFDHSCAHSLDMYLVGPTGAASSLMSDVGDCTFPSVSGLDLAFTSAATQTLAHGVRLASGTYAPSGDLILSDPDDAVSLAPPGPNVDIPADFSVFDGLDPNGPWKLYIYNDTRIGSGNLRTWELTLHLAPQCEADITGDNPPNVDVFDLLAYLGLWFDGDPAAERTGDTPASIDVFDLLAYLEVWFPGC